MIEINHNTTELDNSSEKKVKKVALIGLSMLMRAYEHVKKQRLDIEFIPLALSSTSTYFSIYCICKYINMLKQCDVIFCDNLTATQLNFDPIDVNEQNEKASIVQLLKLLSSIGKPIVILLYKNDYHTDFINKCINYYNLNFVEYTKAYNTNSDILMEDQANGHLYRFILSGIIEDIINNYDKLSMPIQPKNNPIHNYMIVESSELVYGNDENKHKDKIENKLLTEFDCFHATQKCLKIKSGERYFFPSYTYNTYLCHMFKYPLPYPYTTHISSHNKNYFYCYSSGYISQPIVDLIYITQDSFIEHSYKIDNACKTYRHSRAMIQKPPKKKSDFFQLGDMLFIKNMDDFLSPLKIFNKNDCQSIEIKKELDFSYLVPNLNDMHKAVQNYIKFRQPIALAQYKARITNLESKYNSINTALRDLSTFRIDFMIENNPNQLEIISEGDLEIQYPQWFKSASEQGCVIYNKDENQQQFMFYFISPLDSKIYFDFRGIFKYTNDGSRQAFWISYKNVVINDISYGDFSVWHDEPKHIEILCKKNEKFTISFQIQKHRYKYDELKTLLEKTYDIKDEVILKLFYAYANLEFENL